VKTIQTKKKSFFSLKTRPFRKTKTSTAWIHLYKVYKNALKSDITCRAGFLLCLLFNVVIFATEPELKAIRKETDFFQRRWAFTSLLVTESQFYKQ
jgi:hypothetical protein